MENILYIAITYHKIRSLKGKIHNDINILQRIFNIYKAVFESVI